MFDRAALQAASFRFQFTQYGAAVVAAKRPGRRADSAQIAMIVEICRCSVVRAPAAEHPSAADVT